jgi:gluconate 2-dehydrogenase gamma chain
MEHQYQKGLVLALLPTGYVTDATRNALAERLAVNDAQPLFFDPEEFACLAVVCDRLVAQDPERRIVNIAFHIDDRLQRRTCDGWRYDNMPPDDRMYSNGLKGINETAQLQFNRSFIQLTADEQDRVLQLIQQGAADGTVWQDLPPQRFFEELLAETTEIFFSHPSVQDEIGYAGMADAKGWERIGLNEREAIEPAVIKKGNRG